MSRPVSQAETVHRIPSYREIEAQNACQDRPVSPKKGDTTMISLMARLRQAPRVLITTFAVAALTLVLPAALPVKATGLRNCADVIGTTTAPVACYEMVWSDGVQVRMTFSNLQFPPTTDVPWGNFYVLAPQTDTLQGWVPFPHDHVVGDVPSQNHGGYTVHWHAYFVFCSAQGIAGGACVPSMTTIPGFGSVPFAKTVNGQMLTSAEAIEAAANAEFITLFDTGGVLVGAITSGE